MDTRHYRPRLPKNEELEGKLSELLKLVREHDSQAKKVFRELPQNLKDYFLDRYRWARLSVVGYGI